MKREDLQDAIGLLDDDLIVEAESARHTVRRGRRRWLQWVAIAACFCLVVACVLALPHSRTTGLPVASTPSEDMAAGESSLPSAPADTPNDAPDEDAPADAPSTPLAKPGSTATVTVLAKAVYPAHGEKAPARTEYVNEKVSEGMPMFYKTVMGQFLVGEKGENRVFSPLNVYMGLSLLAETSDGESREEILSLLGVKDLDALRRKANLLWEHNYEYQGPDYQFAVLQLGNSLWLKNGLSYNKLTMNTLAKNYYASAFSGNMGSKEYTEQLQNWLNDQTGGVLKEQVSGVELDPSTVLSLVSTIYFGARWVDCFDPKLTAEDVFHAANGDVTAEFMHQDKFGTAYVGEDCKVVPLPLGTGYTMYLALPDEGVSVNELLVDEEFIKSVTRQNPVFETDPQFWDIELTLPKFDISGGVDLADGLKRLGVSAIFDVGKADFTPISNGENIAVSSIKHAARVSIDEEGCTAAAFMQSDLGMGAPVSNGVLKMNFNRPFVFCITGVMGDVLFAGVVERP